jgi:hypothetical protein
MKTAYELAMERLKKSSPVTLLTDAQRREIAELESRYKAKVAEREIFLQGEIAKAASQGQPEEVERLEKQLANDRRSCQAELEEKKEAVRRTAT